MWNKMDNYIKITQLCWRKTKNNQTMANYVDGVNCRLKMHDIALPLTRRKLKWKLKKRNHKQAGFDLF